MNQHPAPLSDPISELSEKLIAHPRFDLAALHYFENVMKWRHEIGFVDRFIPEYSRHIVFYYVCYLHYGNQTGLPENGSTFGRLWELIDRRKECGSRALRTILSIATLAGYLKRVPGLIDRRTVSYAPTPMAVDHMREHIVNTMKSLDILLEVDIYSREIASDLNFMSTGFHFLLTIVDKYNLAFVEIDPLLWKMAKTSGGLATLFAIAEAHVKDIAKSGKFSVSQIRANLTYMTEIGAVTIDPKTNMVVQENTVRLNEMLLARELALHIKFRLGNEGLIDANVERD